MGNRYVTDGHLETIDSELKEGDIIREVSDDGGIPSFSDCVVVSIYVDSIVVGRPYAFASDGEILVGVERFSIRVSSLRYYKRVVNSTGNTANHCMDRKI